MIINIELIMFIIFLGILLLWYVWFRLSRWWHVRRYKKENDKGYIGEEHRQELIRKGKPDPATKIKLDAGLTESGEQPVLQTTETDVDGKTSSSNGKTGFKFRNPFRRRKGKGRGKGEGK